jgi:hypothetical protein
MMLQGSLFADAMGRDLMPDLYPPLRRAAAGYARFFLRMLGAEEDAAAASQGAQPDEKNGAPRRNRGRAADGVKRRNGQGRPARPPRGT